MNIETKNRILKIFQEHSGYAWTKDIRAKGIHHKYLQELVEKGIIIRISKGLYSLPNIEDYSSYYEALLVVPGGIICMGTALSFYELTTWNPPYVHVAIHHGRKVVLPDYPPIKLYHPGGSFFTTGITQTTLYSGHSISIYDLEKTVCDTVRYRNRIGIDVMKESLVKYISRHDKNLNKLYEYAKTLKIISVLQRYMEVLL
ncbi:MAG: type IV toxin-antitoxin system AbiEi family antitoxin domain-containing protein [Spirochaetota bacterium]|nr:type IV toxin-antitoxin system AbiEi family antitoxin domain-containing protein [Spirochaetota bacterium]